jgi:hypothetical protein
MVVSDADVLERVGVAGDDHQRCGERQEGGEENGGRELVRHGFLLMIAWS